jgi:site-specific recombinase XerD
VAAVSAPSTQNRNSASARASRGSATNEGVLRYWVAWLRVERGLSEATIEAYERDLRSLASLLDGQRLQDLATADLRTFLYVSGGEAATVKRRISALASFYGWLVRTERRADDPTIALDRPKVARGLPRPVEDFEERVRRLEPHFALIARFMVETGLRISEACAVDCGTPVPEALRVRGKGGGERVVPLTDVARVALQGLRGRIGDHPREIQRAFAKVHMTPHALRHTFATRLADRDVDLSVIQDLLGHASPETTRVYQRNSAERLRRALGIGEAR